MATFYKSSRLWVVDYLYDGSSRHWLEALPEEDDGIAVLSARLHDLYGKRCRVIGIRQATQAEESDYLRGVEAKNMYCPAGRAAPN
jgi:uncharacterized DUF497 family protein